MKIDIQWTDFLRIFEYSIRMGRRRMKRRSTPDGLHQNVGADCIRPLYLWVDAIDPYRIQMNVYTMMTEYYA